MNVKCIPQTGSNVKIKQMKERNQRADKISSLDMPNKQWFTSTKEIDDISIS